MAFDAQKHEVIEGGYQLKSQPQKLRIITIAAFRRRLTTAEKVAIMTSTDPVVKVLDEDLKVSSFVDLDFSELQQGLDYLISQGILTAERKTALLQDGTPDEAL